MIKRLTVRLALFSTVFCAMGLGSKLGQASYVITTTVTPATNTAALGGTGSVTMSTPTNDNYTPGMNLMIATQTATTGGMPQNDSTFDPTQNQATITITVTQTTTGTTGSITLDDMIGGTIMYNPPASDGGGNYYNYSINETLSVMSVSASSNQVQISGTNFVFSDGTYFDFTIPVTNQEYDPNNDYTLNTSVILRPLTVGLVSSIPEPSSLILATCGLTSLAIAARRRRKALGRGSN